MQFETLGQWLMGIPFLAVAVVATLDGLLRRPVKPAAVAPSPSGVETPRVETTHAETTGVKATHAETIGEARPEDSLKEAA